MRHKKSLVHFHDKYIAIIEDTNPKKAIGFGSSLKKAWLKSLWETLISWIYYEHIENVFNYVKH